MEHGSLHGRDLEALGILFSSCMNVTQLMQEAQQFGRLRNDKDKKNGNNGTSKLNIQLYKRFAYADRYLEHVAGGAEVIVKLEESVGILEKENISPMKKEGDEGEMIMID